MALKSKLKHYLKFFTRLLMYAIACSILIVAIFRFAPVPLTPLMVIKSTASLFSDKRVGIEKKWVPIEEISKPMQLSVIKAEDDKFYQHWGFDFDAIEKAMKYNKTHKKQKGASTISQQTAKNVFLWPSRNWIRKGMEVYFTVLIELMWSKERILEVYLNVIELGSGVYGVEAAANKFFHKKAKQLSAAQAALLASVLPNPIKFRVDRPSAYVLKRQGKIMGRIIARAAPAAITTKPSDDETDEFFDLKFEDDEDEKTGDEVKSASPAAIN
jgi:monofunctional biosynthetic peptidoglycan transglycosylase